jgi:hypothetical protein
MPMLLLILAVVYGVIVWPGEDVRVRGGEGAGSKICRAAMVFMGRKLEFVVLLLLLLLLLFLPPPPPPPPPPINCRRLAELTESPPQ